MQRFGAEVCGLWAPCQICTFFGIALFNNPHPRYSKTCLLAYLVQGYARLGRLAKTPIFLALRISNTPMLGIQKHFCWHIWCKGMRAWSAAPKTHSFLDQVKSSSFARLFVPVPPQPYKLWHSATKTPCSRVSKNTSACISGAPVCALRAPRQNPTFCGIAHFKHPNPGYPKHFCWHIWSRGMRAWGAKPKPHIFWHRAFQTPASYVSKIVFAGISGAEVCAWVATPNPHILWHCAFQSALGGPDRPRSTSP